MRKLFSKTPIVIVAVALVAATVAAPLRAAESKTYGAGVTASTVTPIARLLDRPSDFKGKTVRIEGVVTEVCTMMGCWMALAPSETDKKTMLIQVEHDGVIVFPVSAKGHRAEAQGIVERIDGGEGAEAAGELAEAQGATPESAAQWRIKATGAVIY